MQKNNGFVLPVVCVIILLSSGAVIMMSHKVVSLYKAAKFLETQSNQEPIPNRTSIIIIDKVD